MKHCHILIAVLSMITFSGCGAYITQTLPPIISASSTPDATSTPEPTTGPTIAQQQGTLSPRSTRPATIGVPAALGLSFPIQIGQTVEVASEELSIIFRQVTEDSRCPVDVECFWAGQAVIDVEAAQQGVSLGSFSLTLGQGDNAAQARVAGYRVIVLGLDPVPDTRNPSPPDYVATLNVVLGDE